MKKYWFVRKTYGWGWTPATWEGWTVIGVYLFLVAGNLLAVDMQSHAVVDTFAGSTTFTLIATVVLLCICLLTGESPRWNWGKKQTTGHRPKTKEKSKNRKHKKHTTQKRR